MHKVAEPVSSRAAVSAQNPAGPGEYGEVGRGRPVSGEDGQKGKEELVRR